MISLCFCLASCLSLPFLIFLFFSTLLLEGIIQFKGSLLAPTQPRLIFHHCQQQWKASEEVKEDHEPYCKEKIFVFPFDFGIQKVSEHLMRTKHYYRIIQMCLDCECSMTSSLLKGPGQVMSDFNSHSHRLASLAFWRPIKPDSSPLSLAEGMLKAGKEQLSGMLKSFMMESVNSTNGSLSPCCLVHFISRKSRWQKLYWTLTVSPHILFCSFEKHLY